MSGEGKLFNYLSDFISVLPPLLSCNKCNLKTFERVNVKREIEAMTREAVV